ncbi:MAG: hypothetical protein M1834_007340 [Cirrosporium novae-zelandiae]|nr:MAG: hypothetical protein M1834_007340 [Cirrosporium novae-zelandiae]
MSLYQDAARILISPSSAGGSLKSRIYNDRTLRCSPAQVFALVSESTKWSPILKEVIEKSRILNLEKKLTPILALLLVHDHLISKQGIVAPKAHPLRLAIERHKARLNSELVRARLRRKCHTLQALKKQVESQNQDHDTALDAFENQDVETLVVPKTWSHPRWVRINTLLTTLQHQLATTFKSYEAVSAISEILKAPHPSPKIYHIDNHIPNLLCLPALTDLSSTSAYANGEIIFQDKASCFPAFLIAETHSGSPGGIEVGDTIDACAAPGNKTTHLAALAQESRSSNTKKSKVIACERNKGRAQILAKMVQKAGAQNIVEVLAGQDFLALDPKDRRFQNVTSLLLDPSCSGSGIVGRDDMPKLVLPSTAEVVQAQDSKRGKKRKRRNGMSPKVEPESRTVAITEEPEVEEPESVDRERLQNLAAFQFRIITHAFSFPHARRITYSTCSVHFEENEGVVSKALGSDIGRKRGWRVLKREEQTEGLRKWGTRGMKGEGEDNIDEDDVLDGCIRCSKGTEEGTMGFFVVGFVRDGDGDGGERHESLREDEEWEGFGDD